MSILVFLVAVVVLLLHSVSGIICRGLFNDASISFMETLLDIYLLFSNHISVGEVIEYSVELVETMK